MKTGSQLIADERERQISQEGWSATHDDDHQHGELAVAGACYALTQSGAIEGGANQIVDEMWPWHESSWKPGDPVRNLAKAGALIAAEIDRLQRLNVKGLAPLTEGAASTAG
tara:strand:+ start:456 stop:791 length:336 start_codon:yes stop_codon:yes gene_type:complete